MIGWALVICYNIGLKRGFDRSGERNMEMIPYGEKGRRMGQHNGNAKWSDAAVERMRDLKEHDRKTNAEICKEFNIPKSTLSGILSYKHRAVTPTKWKPKKVKKDEA